MFLRRHLYDWEIEKVIALQNSVDILAILLRRWTHWFGRVTSKVNSQAYKVINKIAYEETDCPWRMIWKPKEPYKVNCLLWLLSKAVLTIENMKRRVYQFAS